MGVILGTTVLLDAAAIQPLWLSVLSPTGKWA